MREALLPAYFKSAEYYDFEEIKELTGVYNFNPLDGRLQLWQQK
jgi:hypothetical protein